MSVKRNLVSRLTRTRLLFPLLLIVSLLPAVHFYATRPKETAAWWNESWIYRKRIDINNPSGSDLTDFQVSFNLDTTDTNKFQSNCEDLRITGVDGNLLPFWIEENNPGCGNTNTKIWVKLPSIPSSGTYVYAYYGNPSASQSPEHDGNKVFEFFDDFSGASLNTTKWQKINGGAPIFSNGTLTITATINPGKLIALTAPQGDNYILRARFQATAGANGDGRAGVSIKTETSDGRGYNYVLRDFINLNQTRFLNDNVAWGTSNYGSWQKNTYYSAEIYHNGTNVHGRINDGSWNSEAWSGRTGYPALNFGSHSDTTTTWDFALVRKTTTTEPTTSTQSEETGPGPIAYWKFDEGTGNNPHDSSSNSYHGTINGANWQSENQCIHGKCLNFNGNSRVDTTLNTNKLSVPITFTAWFYLTQSTTEQPIISGYNGHDDRWDIIYNRGENKKVGWLYHGGGSVYSTDTVSLNEWHQITVIHTGTSIELYLDGIHQNTLSTTKGVNTGQTIRIGAWYSNSLSFKGFIDEVKIYPYARSAEQIKIDYNTSAAILGSTGNNTNTLSDGLVGHWKFDENTGTTAYNSVGNYMNLYIHHDPDVNPNGPWDTGKYGSAFLSAGYAYPDYEKAGTTWTAPTQTNFTISLWFKPQTPPTSSPGYIISRWWGSCNETYQPGWAIQYNPTTQKINMLMAADSCGPDGTLTTNSTFNVNNWYHLVAVHEDGEQIRLYVNGVLDNQTTYTLGLNPTPPALSIGCGANNNDCTYAGLTDEVRIYNRVLSNSEIEQLYNFAPNPQLYYNFDEGTGSSVSDVSGNNNNGTWSGSGSHWSPGKYGSAASFNGTNDFISSSLNTNSLYDISTFELWFKPSTISKKGLISGYPGANPTDNRWDIQLSRFGDTNVGWVSHQGGGYISTTTPIQTEVWHHLAIIHDYTNNSTKIYLNGNLEQTGTAPYPTNTSINLLIGNGDGGYYHGLIDELKIYNYARTEEQIRQDMFGTANPAISSSDILPEPISHWSFDEQTGQTAYDKASNKNGTLGADTSIASDDPTWKTNSNCKTNGCLSFDGNNDYIKIPNFTYPDNQSISLWIKAPNLTLNEWVIGSSWHYEISIRSGKIQFTTHDGSSYQYCTSSTNVNDNSYHFITTTYEDSSQTKKIYIDGELETTCQQGSNAPGTTGTLTIGGGSYFQGNIDEVKIYNSVLTPEQIKQDMNSGSTLTVGTTTNEAAELSDGEGNPPIAEWKLDEMQSSTVYDTSGNNYNGTINGATWNAWCKQGGCLSFQGNQAVDLNSVASITGPITVNAWVKTSTSDTDRVIAAKYGNNGRFTWRVYMNSSGKVVFDRHGYDGTTWSTSVTSTNSINDGNWHYVSAVFDSNYMKIYIDGNYENQTAETRESEGFNTYDLCIGDDHYNSCGASSGWYSPWVGLIDHVKIYDYARTPAQIAYDYNRGEPIAHWKMDECQGSTIHDSSDNGNHGTWNGSGGTQTSVGTCTTTGTAWGNGATGKFGASLNFDGYDDAITITDTTNSPFDTSTISIAFWAKGNAYDGSYEGVMSKASRNNTYTGPWTIMKSDSAYRFTVNGNSTLAANVDYTNIWVHLVFTYDGSLIKAYVDGELNGQQSYSGGITATNDDIILGLGYGTTNNRYFSGQLDDVRIYNYVLSEMQVKKVMNEGSALRFGD